MKNNMLKVNVAATERQQRNIKEKKTESNFFIYCQSYWAVIG